MQILCLFLLVVAVPALVTASLQNNNCIVGCKCKEDDKNYARKLQIVDCDSPLALTANAFTNVSKKINILSFKNVEIKIIDKDAFAGFQELEGVEIEDSNIGSIDPSAFTSQELSTLSFTKTTFGEIPSISSIYLEELIFNDCKLTEVPNLDQLPLLNFLSLANNRIKTIDEMTFAKTTALEEVNLSNNSISKLPRNLIVNNINTFNVDNNPLETFELNLVSDFEVLSLRSCQLKVFDRNIAKKLKLLTSLDLSGNKISVLPIDAFEEMTELTFIDLSDNELVELDDDIFSQNTDLMKIILDGNQFETLPKFQVNTTYFQVGTFSCKNCGLKSIKNSFKNMPNLVALDLSHNHLKDIEEAFTGTDSLEILNLSHNNITAIGPNVFSNRTNLKFLYLSYNPLQSLNPIDFAKLNSLIKLDVSNCALFQLWTNHNQVLLSLEQVVAGNNSLTVVTIEDLIITPNLKLLDLSRNPIQCTQELRYLLEYVKSKNIIPIEESNVLKTHEEDTLISQSDIEDEIQIPAPTSWKKLAYNCGMESIFDVEEEDDNENEDDDIDHILPAQTESSPSIFGDYDSEENDDTNDLYLVGPLILDDKNDNSTRTSYILSISSVFILTALVVLTSVVAITLLILKKNKSFNNMHNGNLPRLKIALWHNTLGQKKHSGSVYKPLSEEYSGPRTPIINRYEFKQTPQVHNSIP